MKVELKRKDPLLEIGPMVLLQVEFRPDLFPMNIRDAFNGLVLVLAESGDELYWRGHRVIHAYTRSNSGNRWISMGMTWIISYVKEMKLAKKAKRIPKTIGKLPA